MSDKVIAMRLRGEGLDKDGQFWSKEDRQKLVNNFYAGIGVTTMAQEFQRSERAIVQQLIAEDCYDNTIKRRNHCVKRSKKCLCGQCESCETCPFSPMNRKDDHNV